MRDDKITLRGVFVLLVLGFIAMLIFLLILPPLMRAREQARRANCKSNLRQIALGCITYSLKNKGNFPADGANWEESTVAGSFKILMKEEVMNRNIFRCPSNLTDTSYGYNPNLSDNTEGGTVLVADNPDRGVDYPSSNHAFAGVCYVDVSVGAYWWQAPPNARGEDMSPIIHRRVTWTDDNTREYIDHIYKDDGDPFTGNFEQHDSKVKLHVKVEEEAEK